MLETACTSGWGYLELPAAHRPRTDPEVVTHLVALARSLSSGATVADESLALTPAATCRRGRSASPTPTSATTYAQRSTAPACRPSPSTPPNRLQGRQFEVTLVWHPLSGRRDASAFHLETGRLCVLASRHRQACIVVARAGIEDQLHEYPADEPVWLGTDPPPIDGWAANVAFLGHLAPFRVPA